MFRTGLALYVLPWDKTVNRYTHPVLLWNDGITDFLVTQASPENEPGYQHSGSRALHGRRE